MSKEDEILEILKGLQAEVRAMRGDIEKLSAEKKKYKSLTIEDMKQEIAAIAKEYGITKATLFGSRARGDFWADSDVDLLLEFSGKITLFQLSGIKIHLEEVWGLPVDLLKAPLPKNTFLEIDEAVEIYAA